MSQSVSHVLEESGVRTLPSRPQSHGLVYTDWVLTERNFEPNQLQARETAFTIGNGYIGTRGSFEEGYPRSMPITLVHGTYDAVPVMYTELVNCPDWLPLTITLNDDEPNGRVERFRLDRGEILFYERQLDLRYGLLKRSIRWKSPGGKTIDINFERFASLADPHILAIRCLITPIDWFGEIVVQASINGYAQNQGFNHWDLIPSEQTDAEEVSSGDRLTIDIAARTRQSQIELGMAANLNVTGVDVKYQLESAPGYPTIAATYRATQGRTATVEKITTIYTSRDDERPAAAAREKLAGLSSYTEVWQQHQQAWMNVWEKSDITIEGDAVAQLSVRYSIFQLLIAAPWWENRVSIPAKTLSGFGYRGHIFWDTEIFMLPLFTFTQPEIARNLLSYRYHTLGGARRKARSYGYKGAMYAWESADSGDEVTPRWALPSDPYASDIRIWCRDREIHISADIAYGIWQYWKATGDDAWMEECGGEILLDTAVFWMSRVEWNPTRERYDIREVIGADEYHEHNVNNNAFTNRMAQWHLEKALFIYEWLQEKHPDRAATIAKKIELTPERLQRWRDIIKHICIPYNADTGFIEQYEGFCNLEDIDLQAYEPRSQSMQSILGIDGANAKQVLKQPDVLMLLYLMRQLHEFPYTPANLQTNWEYYAPRTDITYGSSLGPAIHAILAADAGDLTSAYRYFMQAALVDIENTRGNAVEGIHGACAGGVWQAIVFGFAGITFEDDRPVANPHLPPDWKRLAFKLKWRDNWYEFNLTPAQTTTLPPPEPIVAEPLNRSSAIRGAIFDLDGVLTDTAEYHYRAWQKLADELEIPFDRQANEALRGISRRDSLMKIVGDRPYSEAELEDMMARKNAHYQELIQSMTPADVLPGALPLLTELRRLGIPAAIGSASKNARTVIDKLGLTEWIDFIADGNSVVNPKPAPDLFLFAAEKIGIPAAECVVFEDASAGIDAALAAGMFAVGLGPVDRVGKAHCVLPGLAGISWIDLANKLSQSSAQIPAIAQR